MYIHSRNCLVMDSSNPSNYETGKLNILSSLGRGAPTRCIPQLPGPHTGLVIQPKQVHSMCPYTAISSLAPDVAENTSNTLEQSEDP